MDPKTGGAKGKLLLSNQSGDESKSTSVSERNFLATVFIGSTQNTVSPELPETELPIVNYFKKISVTGFIRIV